MLRIKVRARSLFLHVTYFVHPSCMNYPYYESNKETFARTDNHIEDSVNRNFQDFLTPGWCYLVL
jgi:hypothetical protein